MTETKKVNIELEVDTSTVDSSKNQFQWLIHLAKAIDSWISKKTLLSLKLAQLFYTRR